MAVEIGSDSSTHKTHDEYFVSPNDMALFDRLIKLGDDCLSANQIEASRELYMAALRINPSSSAAAQKLSALEPAFADVARTLGEARNLKIPPGKLAWQTEQRYLRSLTDATGALLVLPLVLHALRKRIRVRFISMWCDVIGALASHTDFYLCYSKWEQPDVPVLDIFYRAYWLTPTISNQQLQKMLERTLCVLPVPDSVVALVNELPDSDLFFPPDNPSAYTRDLEGLSAKSPPHLTFTPMELLRGKAELRRLGLPDAVPFVCFHARDQSYDVSLNRYATSTTNYRDSKIRNLLPTMEMLTRRGYYVFRMGSTVADALPTSNPMIIDYAMSSHRSDFMDVYLMANCAFFLGGDSGIYALADIFRRPYAMANFVLLNELHTWNACPFIPKRFWSIAESRFLSLTEIFERGISGYCTDELYQKGGVELIENTPEELQALATEVEERVRGVWQSSEEDEALQNKWWAIFKRHVNPQLHGVYRARVGAAFLRQHRYWLD